MPLSPEDQALIEQDFNAQSLAYLFSGGYGPMLERLLNACRLEERAKAEGEVEEAHKLLDLIGQARTEGEGPGEDVLTIKGRIINLEADRLTSELRATQAEELVREVVGVLEPFAKCHEWDDVPRHFPELPYELNGVRLILISDDFRRASEALAKLKAAPLQGGGSSSASSTEHSPSGRTSTPSSTGGEG